MLVPSLRSGSRPTRLSPAGPRTCRRRCARLHQLCRCLNLRVVNAVIGSKRWCSAVGYPRARGVRRRRWRSSCPHSALARRARARRAPPRRRSPERRVAGREPVEHTSDAAGIAPTGTIDQVCMERGGRRRCGARAVFAMDRLERGGRPRERRRHDRPALAPASSSSSCSNDSPNPPVLPEAMAPSRASFEG